MRRFFKEEKGDIIIITAALFTVLLFFVGIAVDLGMVYFEHSRLDDYCQMVKEDRFTHSNQVLYAENPAYAVGSIAGEVLSENGFSGEAALYFMEDEPQENYRHYKARLVLQKEVPYHFLVLFHQNSVTVSSSIDFEDSFGELSSDKVWHPADDISIYNGRYVLDVSGHALTREPASFPSDW